MNFTPSALHGIGLLSPDSPFKFALHGSMIEGFHLDLVSNAEPLASDVTISFDPPIIADLASVSYLTGRTIDLIDNEFVIRDT